MARISGSKSDADDGVKTALTEMEALLRRVGAIGHADQLVSFLALLESDRLQAIEILAGGAIWGSAGSFLDLYLCRANGHKSDNFKRDNRSLNGYLLRLLQALENNGVRRPYFDQIRDFLT